MLRFNSVTFLSGEQMEVALVEETAALQRVLQPLPVEEKY